MPCALVQRWHLIGLLPIHDAAVRRLAHEECLALQMDSRDLSIAWTAAERMHRLSEWVRPAHADVVIATADCLVEALDGEPNASQPFLPGTENPSCLRLVWSGLNGSRNDLEWATAWFASGTIIDPTSLQSWVRTAVRHAASVPKPPHPFLRDLRLPSA
ncbi:MAG: hypothetical protein ACK553_12245 [Planctomycetota bacterium]|jgi:hypothetical protein